MGKQSAIPDLSPYRHFTVEEWAEFRADTPLTLTQAEIERLRSMNDPVDLEEVSLVYLALSRLLSSHVEAMQQLFEQRRTFLNVAQTRKTPFILGIAGSVAVGKSTTARVLKELMSRWPSSPKVDLVTTDGFLYPNAVLEEKGLMHRKGFPESYDVGAVLKFLSGIKSGASNVQAPLYSHFSYDVLPDTFASIDQPDILIFEGINVLQVRDMPADGQDVPFVSDFFDFSLYIDADPTDIRGWYIDRFMDLRVTAFLDEKSFFHRYSKLSDEDALTIANGLWDNINRINLEENIQPTRPRADLILRKGKDHFIEQVSLRKL